MTASRRALIVTADDFGLDPSLNEAVERAHREGVLTAASLMVNAPAAADAIERARRMPTLAVGLHVVVVDGCTTARMVREGFRLFFLPRARRELAAQIRAQFEAFAATGLPLDHVNAHHHFHVHPTVLGLILSIGREFGVRAVRLPAEPGAPIRLRPWLALMRIRIARAGLACNDRVFGIERSGAMNEWALLQIARRLPDGVSEIYLHPTMGSPELQALLSHDVRVAFDATGAQRGGFAAVLSPRARPRSPARCATPSPAR